MHASPNVVTPSRRGDIPKLVRTAVVFLLIGAVVATALEWAWDRGNRTYRAACIPDPTIEHCYMRHVPHPWVFSAEASFVVGMVILVALALTSYPLLRACGATRSTARQVSESARAVIRWSRFFPLWLTALSVSSLCAYVVLFTKH